MAMNTSSLLLTEEKKMEDLNIAGEGVDGEKQLKENVSYWKGISAAKT